MFATGSALYCWECSSNRDPWCDDPINITEHRRTFNPTPCGYKNQYPNYGNDRYVCRKMVKRGILCDNLADIIDISTENFHFSVFYPSVDFLISLLNFARILFNFKLWFFLSISFFETITFSHSSVIVIILCR